MGYYVDLSDANWEIKETPEALATIREMPVKYHAIKRGGSSNGEKWFSWMNDAEIENAESVEIVFNRLGFDTEKVDGGFKLAAYNSKTGQEDLFLAVMAPFTAEGSWIEWRGEDGALWKNEIINGHMYRLDSEIAWTNAAKYKYDHFTFDPKTSKSGYVAVDIYAPATELAEQLSTIQASEDEKQAYYDKIRAGVAEANAEALKA